MKHRNVKGRLACESRDRDWSPQNYPLGSLKITSNHQKLGESHGTEYPSEPPEETNLADTWISDFQPPEE